jgi:hypothetical protein
MDRYDLTQPRSKEDADGRWDASHNATDHDPTGEPLPPANPETDREAVEEGQEKLVQVLGR